MTLFCENSCRFSRPDSLCSSRPLCGALLSSVHTAPRRVTCERNLENEWSWPFAFQRCSQRRNQPKVTELISHRDQSRTHTWVAVQSLLCPLSCFWITVWTITTNHAMALKMCLIYTVMFSVTSAWATIFLSHMLVLMPRCNRQHAWIEGIIMLTLITIMVELAITRHITFHEVLRTRWCNCFLFSVNKHEFGQGKRVLVHFRLQRGQIRLSGLCHQASPSGSSCSVLSSGNDCYLNSRNLIN